MSTPVAFQLSAADAAALPCRITQGHASARSLSRARVLLLAHQGLRPETVAAAVLVSRATVYMWTRYRAEGLEGALHERPRRGQPR
ncbi:MAG: helix-turn-helix domain-containing protein [Hymenobacteraceae bacterium]|nr:helix-turn-helix domain-containing protein [Hymenobacteraceae bacterium]